MINDLRLHLSWDLGVRVFHWSREAVGTRILLRFNELGILLFMKQIIRDDRNRWLLFTNVMLTIYCIQFVSLLKLYYQYTLINKYWRVPTGEHVELKTVFRTGFFFEKVLEKNKYVKMMQRIYGVDSRSQNFSITSTKKPRDLPEKSCKNRGFLNIHLLRKMGGSDPPGPRTTV